ncbi:uncharacterized protein LOC116303652 isoform X2 [Actinia tenebrosa]|uniref:Uncharacterized protein LOC116303652 isoform X2 n=1 Tax=Actinia tenebrosa TaxID=6105 RepID=A0A6P8IS79_ACTTE|nr:uncharacterized protein LOC116303652 isoform X2 [Actinia tenebrosa]
MADAQQRTEANEIAEFLSEFLLSAEVSNAYTLDEFKELFPLKFRDHEDVKQLYKAFQSKRKKLKAVIKRNIARHCSAANMMSLHLSHEQNNSSVPGSNEESSDNEQQHLKEKLLSVRKDCKAAENQFMRCEKQLSDFDIFQGLNNKDFNVHTLQLLREKLEKPDLTEA